MLNLLNRNNFANVQEVIAESNRAKKEPDSGIEWLSAAPIPIQSFGSWALVGPPGVGKTTLADRIVGEYEREATRPVFLDTLDDIRGVVYTHRFIISPTVGIDRTL